MRHHIETIGDPDVAQFHWLVDSEQPLRDLARAERESRGERVVSRDYVRGCADSPSEVAESKS